MKLSDLLGQLSKHRTMYGDLDVSVYIDNDGLHLDFPLTDMAIEKSYKDGAMVGIPKRLILISEPQASAKARVDR